MAPTTTTLLRLLLAAAAVVVRSLAAEHNITEILAGHPEYSAYNGYLTKTGVADEINSRETITCLVLTNPAMNALAAKHPLSAVKNALRLLTLLDFFDAAKLHDISEGTVVTTTLLQTTGNTPGNLGAVNITDLKGGKVGFGANVPGSKLECMYTKSVKQIAYSLSVLEVSAPIIFPGLLETASYKTANVTALLEKAGCKTFASFIVSSGVLKLYEDAMEKGLTIFAPTDEAFEADGVPDLHKLSQAELVTLLQYHAIPRYAPKATLMSTAGNLTTLATGTGGKYNLGVLASGQDVSLRTDRDRSHVASTVLDDTPVCIMTVDKVLLPTEIFGMPPAPSPAPAEAPEPTEAPAPNVAEAPAPESASPPAPPADTPEGAPADAPGVPADVKGKKKTASAAGAGAWPWAAVVIALAAAAATVTW